MKLVYNHDKMNEKELEEFFGHIEGKKEGIGMMVHPLFYSRKKEYPEFQKKIEQILKNRKFPTIALVGPNKMEEVQGWLEKLQKEEKITKPIMLMKTKHSEDPTPKIGFEKLSKILKGKVKNVYLFGETGIKESKEEVLSKMHRPDYQHIHIKNQLKEEKKTILTGGCIAGTMKGLMETGKNDFKVKYLPKKVYERRM